MEKLVKYTGMLMVFLSLAFTACDTSGSREAQMNDETRIGEDQDKTTVNPDTVSTTGLTTGSDSAAGEPRGGMSTQ